MCFVLPLNPATYNDKYWYTSKTIQTCKTVWRRELVFISLSWTCKVKVELHVVHTFYSCAAIALTLKNEYIRKCLHDTLIYFNVALLHTSLFDFTWQKYCTIIVCTYTT